MPLADLLTTTDEDARSGADSIPASTAHSSPDSDRIDIKGFDIVPLSILWAYLANQEWNVSLIEAFECVFTGFDNDGPWIYKVPEDFVGLLVQLQADSLKSAAKFWAQTEELARFAEHSPLLVEQTLSSIVTLARRARSLNQALYLWMDL